MNENAVESFLNLISKSRQHNSDARLFPFENAKFKRDFAHTIWFLPNVASCVAMQKMLEEHPSFLDYKIVNVAGDNFEGDSALANVQKAIRENNRTITLSAGRLSTGVTVPEWSAVLLLSNMRSPMTYLQAIFRGKSAGFLPDGRVKEKAYVFDFSPDRALEMVVSSSEKMKSINDRDKSTEEIEKDNRNNVNRELDDYLKYFPILQSEGNRREQL